MTTSTIELMRAAIAAGDGGTPATYLNIVSPNGGPPGTGTAGALTSTEVTHTSWGHGIRVTDDLMIIPGRADAVPLWMTCLYGTAPPRQRLRPMNPHNLPRGIMRSRRYLSLLRKKAADPETFHRFLAADTVSHLRELMNLRGARTLDVGGQAGYMSEALRDEGATCHVVEHRCQSLEPHDGMVDRSLCSDGASLPLASGTFDLVYSSDVLPHVADPRAMLDEATRVLRPGTGIGYLAFTNDRSPLRLLDPHPTHHPLSIEEVLAWFDGRRDVELRNAEPRFWPAWANRVVEVPRLREYATGSLRVVFRRLR